MTAREEAIALACSAHRQHLADRPTLAEDGVTRRMLERSLKAGELRRIWPGVYATTPLPARGRYLLTDGNLDLGYLAEVRAVLLCLGGGCAARARTAALLWCMDMLVEPKDIAVALPRSRTRVQLKGVTVKRPRRLVVVDHEARGWIRCR